MKEKPYFCNPDLNRSLKQNMLNRRHFRIKTLQAIYAYILSENDQLLSGEKLLISSIDKLHELYIHQLSLLVEITEYARQKQEEAKLKYFPTEEDLNPNTRFVNNIFIHAVSECADYQKYYGKYAVNWTLHPEMIKKLFLEIKESDAYHTYMTVDDLSREAEVDFVEKVVRNVISCSEMLFDYFEDKNLFWAGDFDLSVELLLKTLKQFSENHFTMPFLPSLLKEDTLSQREDMDYMKRLFTKTIIHAAEYDIMIKEQLENWELERMALMDNLLIKMAICELTEFPSIPVKVTLNEYIELSKSYSTPKSNHFINGILDKLLVRLKEEKKLQKRGRGLME